MQLFRVCFFVCVGPIDRLRLASCCACFVQLGKVWRAVLCVSRQESYPHWYTLVTAAYSLSDCLTDHVFRVVLFASASRRRELEKEVPPSTGLAEVSRLSSAI